MKKIGLLTTLLVGSLLLAGCNNAVENSEITTDACVLGDQKSCEENSEIYYDEDINILDVSENAMNIVQLKVGDKTFDITLEDNSSTKALLEKLEEGDIIVNAHDYGNFEKVGELGFDLPTNDEQITTELGDLILYQGNQITLYYDTNSWNFTRLGKVHNITKSDLGDGDVTLVFSLIK